VHIFFFFGAGADSVVDTLTPDRPKKIVSRSDSDLMFAMAAQKRNALRAVQEDRVLSSGTTSTTRRLSAEEKLQRTESEQHLFRTAARVKAKRLRSKNLKQVAAVAEVQEEVQEEDEEGEAQQQQDAVAAATAANAAAADDLQTRRKSAGESRLTFPPPCNDVRVKYDS
jgi:hypothetical protein